MARYIDKDQVIEWVKQRLIPIVTDGNIDDWERGSDNERINFLSYINTLPEEPASENLEEEYDNYFKKHEMDIVLNPYTNCKDIARHFAEWQKQQMMKDAVEAKVDFDLDGNIKLDCEYEFHVGDKVKIIIIKTE